VRSDIVPPNRVVTIALALGILTLIAYGVYNHDPATIVIIATLFIFIAMPALLLYSLNRRDRLRPPSSPDDGSDDADDA
jgi:hypothetical membrane protein